MTDAKKVGLKDHLTKESFENDTNKIIIYSNSSTKSGEQFFILSRKDTVFFI